MKKYFFVCLLFSLVFLSCEEEKNIVDISYLPSWTKLVFFADVENTLSSKELMGAFKGTKYFKRIQKALTNTGIVVERDLKKFMLASDPAEEDRILAFIEINYDKEKVLSELGKDRKVEKIGAYDTISGAVLEEDLVLAFINDRHMLLTRRANLSKSFDIIEGRGNVLGKESELYKGIKNIDRNKLFWGIISFSKAIRDSLMNREEFSRQEYLKNHIDNITMLSFGGDKKELDNKLFVSILNANEGGANFVYSTITGFLGIMVGLYPPQSAEANVIGAINVTKQGNRVRLDLSIKDDTMAKLVRKSIK